MDFLENLETKDSYHSNRQLSEQINDGVKTHHVHATKKILQLRRQRDALKNQLKSLETMISENKISLEEDSPESDSAELVDIKEHHHNLLTLLDCFRLTGFSVFSVDNSNAIFSYDTSYNGSSKETYYLEIQDLQNKNFQVVRHSFPGFIPVLELEDKLLKIDPKQFLNKLNDYLYAYVTRREEVKIVQKNFEDKVTLSSSEPVDFVEIKVGHPSDILQLEFQLTYTDLLHTLPSKTRLTVMVTDDTEGHSIKPKDKLIYNWKNSLQKQLLSDAMSVIMGDYNKLTVYTFDN